MDEPTNTPNTPAAANQPTFFAQWRANLQRTLPVLKAEVGKLGMMGISAASLALLVNDPALYPGLVTGMLGNFIAGAAERWRNADPDQQRALIAADLRAHPLEAELQAAFQQLDWPALLREAFEEKLDDITRLLQDMRDAGLATTEQINAQHSQGLVYKPTGLVNQHFGDVVTNNITHIIQQAQGYTFETLHELRAIKNTFTGRTREIAQLLALVEPPATNLTNLTNTVSICSSVTGRGGVGKSELANVVAHALAPRYPDAQLWLELGAHSVNPRTPEQALERVLHTLHPEARLPEGVDALRALYLHVLSGKRGLVVIDDARNDDDVGPLLPPAGWLTIITSRASLATGAPLRLESLARHEAIALLRRFRAGLSEADADALAAACADLPVALNVAGSYLKTKPSLGAGAYLAALRAAPFEALKFGADEKNDVARVFAHSARQLPPEQRAAWCALSVMPADFDRAAGAAVCGLPDAGLSHPLDALTELSLLDYDPQTERFGWHDLLQKFAAGPGDAAQAARQRHTAHFTQVARHAQYELYLKGQQSVGLALFDRERKHIEAAFGFLNTATEVAHRERAILTLVDAVVYTGQELRFHPRQRITWSQAQASAARAVGDRRHEGAALGNLSLAYAELGEVSKAIEFYEQQLAIAREIGDRRSEGNALGNLGSEYAELGEMSKAIGFFEQDLAIAREIGDRSGEGSTLGNLGVANYRLGEVNKAIGFHEQYLVIAREIGDRRGEGNALGNLGIAYAALGEVSKAIGIHEQQLAITREIGDRQGEAIARWNLGLEYETQGDLQRAAELMQMRVHFLRELGHPDVDQAAAYVAQVRAKLAGRA